MGARRVRKVLVFGMVGMFGLAVLAAGSAAPVEAQGLRAREALLVVYNAGERDVDLGLQVRGFRGKLADDLRADEVVLVVVPAGRAKIEAVRAGVGRARWAQLRPYLVAGHAYCLMVGGRESLDLQDHTEALLAERNPAELCIELGRR